MSSQESVDSVVSDTPVQIRKNNRNGSDDLISASPPKKTKRTRRKQACTKETVREDTGMIVRYFLLRNESITEKDLENDLEIDADSAEDDVELSEEMKENIIKVAERLGKHGDDINKKYKDQFEKAAKSLIQISAYAKFKDIVDTFCSHVCDGSDPSRDSLALVFHLVGTLAQAAKDAGRSVQEAARFAEQYVNDVYGAWIEDNGGWGTAV